MRALEREFGRPIGVLQDLRGLKIRIGFVESGKLMLDTGETVRFARRSRRRKTVDPSTSSGNIRSRGSRPGLLIDDGRVRPSVKKPGDGEMVARIVVGGMIRDHKGINLPEDAVRRLSSDKERSRLRPSARLGRSISFVQKPSDLIEAPALIGDAAGLIDKIETPMALDRTDDIIHLSDAIMVARGDFGVEIPSEEVRGRQKELIRALSACCEACDRRNQDAGLNGRCADADARVGLRCCNRALRWSRRSDAVCRIGKWRLSGRGVAMMDRVSFVANASDA
ncbi:pyruvate kinase [Bradyrhizobium sp. Pa8]|uniref:pyruvate kinase n=1 Tax=Bradyrhizobium sp. Pa8 TaxID=3386552 RepID=UPI00403F71FB